MLADHFKDFVSAEIAQSEKEGELTLHLGSANLLSDVLETTDRLKAGKRIDAFWVKNIDLENLLLLCSKD